MATYGAQPQSKSQSAGLSNTSFGREESNRGLFADLFSSQPSPQNLTVPQKDLLVFFPTAGRNSAKWCSLSAGIAADR